MRTPIYLFLAFALVASCVKKKIEPEETTIPVGVTPMGKLNLLLGSVYKEGGEYRDFEMFPDTGLSAQSIAYGTAAGDLVILSEFRYFVHHMVLFKANGDSVSLQDSIFVVRNTPEYRYDNTVLQNIPEGSYTKITFYIGAVDAPALTMLRKKAPEFFLDNNNYDFLYFRGLYQNKDTAAVVATPAKAWKKVEWSLASPSNPEEPYSRKVTCPLFAPIAVKSGENPLYLHVRVNILGLFGLENQATSHLIDIKTIPIGRFRKSSDLLYENLFVSNPIGTSEMFVNDHIHPN